MMTSSNKYANAKIYKVVDNAYTLCYYGSTTQQLSRRMSSHRGAYRVFGKGQKCSRSTVFDIFDAHGVDNCKIELVEECPCESVEQLRMREGFYIRNNECVNELIAGRTLAERLEATKDHRKERSRNWRARNPDYQANWKAANPDYQSNWKAANPEYQANWRAANPEYHANWRAANLQKKVAARQTENA
jgi:nucleotidyltransferase/DNA polymerase involved in DNA repair